MPRVARVVAAGLPHHVTQRGNNRQDVFFVDDDRRVYLTILRERCEEHGLEVLGWCLMLNHVHLVVRPAEAESLSKAVGRTHYEYSQYVNRMHGRSGHLWQNRFYSCPLGKVHFWRAMRYVEQNPVRAGLVKQAWEYGWSSAGAHVGRWPDRTGLLDMAWWRQASERIDWREALAAAVHDEQVEEIRANTLVGRPLASDSLVSKLEVRLGRRLRPLPVGRPKKRGSENYGSATGEGVGTEEENGDCP